MPGENANKKQIPSSGDLVLEYGPRSDVQLYLLQRSPRGRTIFTIVGASSSLMRSRWVKVFRIGKGSGDEPHLRYIEDKAATAKKVGKDPLNFVFRHFPHLRHRRLFAGRYQSGQYDLVGNVSDGFRAKETIDRQAKRPSAKDVPEEERIFVPGAILYTSWGYEQTNVDFYLITERTGCFVTIQKVGCHYESQGPMQGQVVADITNQVGEPFRKKICVAETGSGDHKSVRETHIKIDKSRYAWWWDGRPRYVSSYA